MYKEKVSESSIGDANKWLKEYRDKIYNLADRTRKSFNQRIKVFEKRFRYDVENVKLENNDMFAVFGEKLGAQMLLSRIPKPRQITELERRLEEGNVLSGGYRYPPL